MSDYKDIMEILEAAADEENSLEEKYIFLRSAYYQVMKEMDKTRLELDKERVAAIKDEKEKASDGPNPSW